MSLASGCTAPEPTDACLVYVDCQRDFDAASGGAPVDTTRYQATGACWTDLQTAGLCDQECADALVALQDSADSQGLDVPSCEPPPAEAE
jgi:hypothetical protein